MQLSQITNWATKKYSVRTVQTCIQDTYVQTMSKNHTFYMFQRKFIKKMQVSLQ